MSNAQTLWAPLALLAEGWVRDVLIRIDDPVAGLVAGVDPRREGSALGR